MNSKLRSIVPYLIVGASLGALAAVFFDPKAGRGRRAKVRAKSRMIARQLAKSARRSSQKFWARGQGILHDFSSAGQSGVEVDDVTLLQRVRSELGHIIRHLSHLKIDADQGVITLNGPVSSRQAQDIISCIQNLPGIRGLKNQLTVQDYSDMTSRA